jgi:LysM repeat protein
MTTDEIDDLGFSTGCVRADARPLPPITFQQQDPGDISGEAIPVPIPNTEVKLSSAEDTERAASREHRSSPGFCAFRRPSFRPRCSRRRPQRRPSILRVTMPASDATAPDSLSDAEPRPVGQPARLDESVAAADAVCPFLIAAGGAWRLGMPDRDHRCAAFSPATSLALGKQARLCLAPGHVTCATYLASTSARTARVGSNPPIARAGRWGIARTTPIVGEVGGMRATLSAVVADRRSWPAIPAVLLATLALALGLSGSWGKAPGLAAASPTPSAGPTTTPTASATAGPTSTPTPAASPEPSVTTPPTSPTPRPSVAYTTYKVKSGDTLYVIAQRYGTTVKAIQKLNNMTTTTLHVGQILKIPTS